MSYWTGKTLLQIERMASSDSVPSIAPTAFTIVLFLTIISAVVSSLVASETETSGSETIQLGIELTYLVLVLAGFVLFMMSGSNIFTSYGLIGLMLVCSSLVLLAARLSIVSTQNSGFNGGISSVIGASILGVALIALYYGSSGKDTTRMMYFYGSFVLLALYVFMYVIVFGDPNGIVSDIKYDDLGKLNSTKYSIIYNSSSKMSGPFKRRLNEQVYLSIAYPTLGDNDVPPVHNTNEVSGYHTLENYGRRLQTGASAFFFDIFYETNPSSPNVNTWRVGTLNTEMGVVQSRRTISLASVLYATNQAIVSAPGQKRLIYLFLNPRYTKNQSENIPKMEDSLAKLITDNIHYLTLPSLTVDPNGRIEDQLLDNARQQCVIVLGGAKSVASISPKLKNVIHGVVNLTGCYVKTENANKNMAFAYDVTTGSSNPARVVDLGSGSFAGANEITLNDYVPKMNPLGVQKSFVATFPNSNSALTPYTNSIPCYITHGVTFPFVYPRMLTRSAYESSDTSKMFYQGFAPIASPKNVVSMVFSNRDGDEEPARQRTDMSSRCEQMENGKRILNPANDDEWATLIENPKDPLKRTKWCENYKKGLPTTILNYPAIFPLVLWNPDNSYSGGMIPKPTLVQVNNGDTYQLRQIVTQTEVQSSSIDQ